MRLGGGRTPRRCRPAPLRCRRRPAAGPPNTTVVPPNTTVTPPSTSAGPPNTTAVPPNTTAMPPSTSSGPPNTTVVPPNTTVMPPSSTTSPGASDSSQQSSTQPRSRNFVRSATAPVVTPPPSTTTTATSPTTTAAPGATRSAPSQPDPDIPRIRARLAGDDAENRLATRKPWFRKQRQTHRPRHADTALRRPESTLSRLHRAPTSRRPGSKLTDFTLSQLHPTHSTLTKAHTNAPTAAPSTLRGVEFTPFP